MAGLAHSWRQWGRASFHEQEVFNERLPGFAGETSQLLARTGPEVVSRDVPFLIQICFSGMSMF